MAKRNTALIIYQDGGEEALDPARLERRRHGVAVRVGDDKERLISWHGIKFVEVYGDSPGSSPEKWFPPRS
jgi:hypothetical protein